MLHARAGGARCPDVGRIAERSRAARACCRRLEAAFGAAREKSAIKLKAELRAWDAVCVPAAPEHGNACVPESTIEDEQRAHETSSRAGAEELEEAFREYPALVTDVRAALKVCLAGLVSAVLRSAACIAWRTHLRVLTCVLR